jgi:hypothetical protein
MDIRFADPVSAIGMNEKYIVIGSMMGRIAAFSLTDKKTTLLAELSSENITGITFESIDTFNVAVGDEEVLKYKFTINNAGQTVPDYIRLKNYENENTHKNRCDSCFTLLSNNHLALIYMNQPNESSLNIMMQSTSIKIKNILTNSMDDYFVDMTNYAVPFDFDGGRLAWVEFLSENERNVCVYFSENNFKWTYEIKKDFGHISQLKLMPNNKIFLTRNLNQCEIRECDKDFKVLYKFTHIGDETLAVDYYVNSSKILLNDMELDNIQIGKGNEDREKDYIKIPVNNINIGADEKLGFEGNDGKEMIHIKEGGEDLIVSDENITIPLLDIDGNLNVWENLSVMKLFNLYDMKDINEEYKNKQFFSMGYPYYVKSNSNYFAISTDHGVFVIKKGN